MLAAESALKDFDGDVLVLFGDAPLAHGGNAAEADRRAWTGADIAALGFRAADPTGYGRMVTKGDALDRIVEHKDASEEERRIGLCFAGMLAGQARDYLRSAAGKSATATRRASIYLTDVIALARDARACAAPLSKADGSEMLGVNSRAQSGRGRSGIPGAPPRAS